MRNHKLFLIAILVLAVGLAAGCGKRALTKSEEDRLAAIQAKIAEAERIGPPDCLDPKLHAKAVVELEHARHEFEEAWGTEHVESATKEADEAADALLKATRDCVARRIPPPNLAPTPMVSKVT